MRELLDEIASMFESAGLPGGFHIAAGDVYLRLAHFKEEDELPDLNDVLSTLLEKRE